MFLNIIYHKYFVFIFKNIVLYTINMTKICIFMPTTITVDENCYLYKKNQLTSNNIRENQYIEGIKKIYELNKEKNIDIYLCDNSTFFNNDSTLKDYLLNNTKIHIINNVPNVYGKYNKGCGLIEQWLYNKDILSKYDYIIHFEPRLLLQSNIFIDNFMLNPRTIFNSGGGYFNKDNNSYKHYNTGLFSIKTDVLLQFINLININGINSIIRQSIEYVIFDFIKNNNITIDLIDKLDLWWFPANEEKMYF